LTVWSIGLQIPDSDSETKLEQTHRFIGEVCVVSYDEKREALQSAKRPEWKFRSLQ